MYYLSLLLHVLLLLLLLQVYSCTICFYVCIYYEITNIMGFKTNNVSVTKNEQGNFIYMARNEQLFMPHETLVFVHNAIKNGDSLQYCINEMRMLLGSETFRSGIPESYIEKMRTIIATLYYKYMLQDYAAKGVDFIHHLYVPEVDSITMMEFHERADHGHLLKRIAGGNSLTYVHYLFWCLCICIIMI